MPRGKASKKSKLQPSAAFQNALTTRLIQISLKTDDHIYYGKHISPSAAKEYVQEITCLKQKCPRTNLHALQVIEKLLSIMKTIITEDQDSQVNDFTNLDVQVYTGFLRTSSPVYSLPDEDSIDNFTEIPVINISDDINHTAIRQEKIIENVFHAISNMAIQDEFVIETQAMIENCNYTDIPIIDITEDSDSITTTQQEKTIKNVYNATSNVVIQDEFIIETQAMFEEDDCSQSILDNFHDNNAVRNEILQMENNAIANPSDLNYCVAKTQHLNEISLNFNGVQTNTVDEHSQCILIEPQNNPKGPQSVVCELKETESVTHFALGNSLTGIQIPKKISDTYNLKTLEAQPTVTKSNTSFNCISDKVKETEPKPKEKKKRAQKKTNNDKKERKKRTPKSKVHMDNETADDSIKPKPKRKGSQTKRLVNEAHKKNPDENTPMVEIYNSNVENDLSWVENLRFVREISPEENDQSLIIAGENFWDNFSLPTNWNDLDFDS